VSSRRIVEVALGVLLAVLVLVLLRSCEAAPREVRVEASAPAAATDPAAPTSSSSSTSSTSTSTTAEGPVPAPTTAPAPAPPPRASRSAARSGGSVSSTAYCLTGAMANGRPARRGAVASNAYPLGTRLRVSPSPVGEVVTVEDRIGHGSELDFALPGDCAAAIAWGRRRVVIVEVLDRGRG